MASKALSPSGSQAHAKRTNRISKRALTRPCIASRLYAHHWVLEGQNAPYMRARCGHCGGRRLFKTSWPDRINWAAEREARLRRERGARKREKR